MFRVFECVAGQHDQRIVWLAAAVCAVTMMSLFVVMRRAQDCVALRRRQWLAIGALTAGIGVWATHFISMLAYRGLIPLRFDGPTTALSAVLAMAAFWIAIRDAGDRHHAPSALRAGLIVTIGVVAMHFTGMAAVIAPVTISYAFAPIAIATVVAFAGFSAAFALFRRLRGWRRVGWPSILTVGAIVAIHFGTMAATTLLPDPTVPVETASLSREWLIASIAIVTILLLTLTLVGANLDRLFTDLRGLADATPEGLMIVIDGRIVEANRKAATMLGRVPEALIGTPPQRWLTGIDRLADTDLAGACVEGRVVDGADPDQVIEIGSRAIEYRGRAARVLAIRDLTDRKRAMRRVEYLATHDPLTGLANRAAFEAALPQRLVPGKRVALLAIDLDRFKAVNDVFGHAAGDAILKRVAALLSAVVDEGDLIARMGGDEFLILFDGADDDAAVRGLTRDILDAFASEMDPARDPMAVGCSVGVALYPQDASDGETLRHNADVALYRAKQEGRGIACFFDSAMDRLARERRQLEHDLRFAIARRQLHLAFQPLVSTAFGTVVGYEALLRWSHPDRGDIPPEEFVPVAEETGVILMIGEWVLRRACRIAAGWDGHLVVAVNVSPVQFRLSNLPAVVRSALDESGLDPRRLELEVTESTLIRDREATLATLHRIKDMGVRIAMDDFGTGYSSLSNLRCFPFDKIKIDRSFISTVADDDAARSIIRAIVGLGRSLNLPVVAEGVETEEQRRMVLEEGCPQAQGFLFGAAQRCDTFAFEDVGRSASNE